MTHYIKYCVIGIAVTAAVADINDLQVGLPIPPIAIGDKGKPFPLGRIVQEGPVAILSRSPPITKGDCEAIYRASERLAGQGSARRPRYRTTACTAKPNVVLPTDAANSRRFSRPPDASIREAWRLIVADPIGSVRVLKTLPVTPTALLARSEWQLLENATPIG